MSTIHKIKINGKEYDIGGVSPEAFEALADRVATLEEWVAELEARVKGYHAPKIILEDSSLEQYMSNGDWGFSVYDEGGFQIPVDCTDLVWDDSLSTYYYPLGGVTKVEIEGYGYAVDARMGDQQYSNAYIEIEEITADIYIVSVS